MGLENSSCPNSASPLPHENKLHTTHTYGYIRRTIQKKIVNPWNVPMRMLITFITINSHVLPARVPRHPLIQRWASRSPLNTDFLLARPSDDDRTSQHWEYSAASKLFPCSLASCRQEELVGTKKLNAIGIGNGQRATNLHLDLSCRCRTSLRHCMGGLDGIMHNVSVWTTDYTCDNLRVPARSTFSISTY